MFSLEMRLVYFNVQFHLSTSERSSYACFPPHKVATSIQRNDCDKVLALLLSNTTPEVCTKLGNRFDLVFMHVVVKSRVLFVESRKTAKK